jgi:hypothetical protein
MDLAVLRNIGTNKHRNIEGSVRKNTERDEEKMT